MYYTCVQSFYRKLVLILYNLFVLIEFTFVRYRKLQEKYFSFNYSYIYRVDQMF